MAQYQRFLSYLFEYEGDQKKENCGFAKVEIRGDVQRISLSVKNKEQAEILHVFGFYRTDGGCGCVPLGRMVVKNGKGQLQYVNNGSHLAGSNIRFEQLCGLVAGRQQPFSNAYATVWDDQYFGLSLFAKDEKAVKAEERAEEKSEGKLKENSDGKQKEKAGESADNNESTDNRGINNSTAGDELQTMEVMEEADSNEEKGSGEEADSNEKKESGDSMDSNKEKRSAEIVQMSLPRRASADGIWEQLSAVYPHIETLPGDSVVCLKAMPADIGRLPRQNWMLSSNGFLMYSFVKHRYIVFARVTNERYELWVPGNYEKSEELMAQMFGFYRFRSVKSQQAGAGDFGYWCVPLTFPSETENAKETAMRR